MPYRYPAFARVGLVQEGKDKRYCLEVELNPGGPLTLPIIQKNPSKANAGYSDHTINRVLNYIHINRLRYSVFREVGTVVFLNLIPWYETHSERLILKRKRLRDPQNTQTLNHYLKSVETCIVAWGNPAAGLTTVYESLALEMQQMLDEHNMKVYHVGPLTRLGYPRHGQIWGYRDPLNSKK